MWAESYVCKFRHILSPPRNPVISFLGVTSSLPLSGGLMCVLGAFLCGARLCVGGAEG